MFFIVLIEFTSNQIDKTFHGLFHLVIVHLSVMQNPSKIVFMLVTKDFPLENLTKRGRCPFFWVHFYVQKLSNVFLRMEMPLMTPSSE